MKFLIAKRNKSVLDGIVWNGQDIINLAQEIFTEAVVLEAVYGNVNKNVEKLEAKEVTLQQILISYAPALPQIQTGSPHLYFISMFKPYNDCSYGENIFNC